MSTLLCILLLSCSAVLIGSLLYALKACDFMKWDPTLQGSLWETKRHTGNGSLSCCRERPTGGVQNHMEHCRGVEASRCLIQPAGVGLQWAKTKLWALPSFKLSVSELKCAPWYCAEDCMLSLCFRPGIFPPQSFCWADHTAHTPPFCVTAFPLCPFSPGCCGLFLCTVRCFLCPTSKPYVLQSGWNVLFLAWSLKNMVG